MLGPITDTVKLQSWSLQTEKKGKDKLIKIFPYGQNADVTNKVHLEPTNLIKLVRDEGDLPCLAIGVGEKLLLYNLETFDKKCVLYKGNHT